MAFSMIIRSCSLKIPWGTTVAYSNIIRCLSTNQVLLKRRKTAEERKAPRIIEYSPKAKSLKTSTVDVWRNITVQQLADSMGRDLEQVQEIMLYVKGVSDFEPSTQLEDPQVVRDILLKAGFRPRIVPAPHLVQETTIHKDHDVFLRPPPSPEVLVPRPPVITVMGHVDHGKTSLLDALRGASVAQGEAGGITQHIGAFTVALDGGQTITFLDTPGHAAFWAMRARGASVTDIIVLVVAADDGVMEQTREVVKLAQDANVPVLVAINKIDKPEADIERTKRELMNLGLHLEDHGGDVQVVLVSATQGTNLDGLAEALNLQAQLMRLTADPTGPVEGVVVESRTDIRRGKLSTAIIQRGTLRKGAVLVSGVAHARVRGIFDHLGSPVIAATPGLPVEVIGWRELPLAGDIIIEVESEKRASEVLRFRAHKSQEQMAEATLEAVKTKEQIHEEAYKAQRDLRRSKGRFKMRPDGPRAKESGPTDLTPRVSVIIKGDVHGSVEAILDVLETYNSDDQCRLSVVHYGVGDVKATDVDLAETFHAIIYAFNVQSLVEPPLGVTIRNFDVIYHLVDDLKTEINKKLPTKPVEEVIGEANVLQLFAITEGRSTVNVLGCRCTKGMLKKSENFKLIREGEVIFEGLLSSMRHLKNEVDTIKKDVECGLRIADQTVKAQPGDTLVCFKVKQEPQETDWDPGF